MGADMKTNILKNIKALQGMKVGELRERYVEVFGETSRSYNRSFLLKRVAWRIQANAEGDLSDRARRRAEEVANDADLRLRAPWEETEPTAPTSQTVQHPISSRRNRRLLPGMVLTREYRGDEIQVTVRNDGFEYDGEVYRSLTAVAKAITGSHWNGYHFFGLARKGG